MGKKEIQRPRYKMTEEEKEVLKNELYEKRGGSCEHPQGCKETNIKKLTLDHFTPQCVARIWEWTAEEVNDPMNMMLLCRPHHDEKDLLTPRIKAINQVEWESNKVFSREQRKQLREKKLNEKLYL